MPLYYYFFFFAAFRRGPLFLMETHPAFLQPGLDLLETNLSLQDFGFGSLTLHSVILRFFFISKYFLFFLL